MDLLALFLKGIAIGMVNVIPGVSGGTLAVVFGIYDKFVNAITFNVKSLWKNRRFVVPLVLGMLLGVLIFSKLIEFLYTHFPLQTNYFFTGLVIGSIPMLFTLMIKIYGNNDDDIAAKETKLSAGKITAVVICALAGLAVMLTFNYLEGKFNADTFAPIMPEFTVRLAIRIFIAGLLGAVAMIVPGISGSLLMLMMGVYTIVITSIPALFSPDTFFHALILLLPNGIGVLLGLVCGAKLISWMLKKFPNQTYAVIFGLICGSIFAVFPGISGLNNAVTIISCILCVIAGAAGAYFSSKVGE